MAVRVQVQGLLRHRVPRRSALAAIGVSLATTLVAVGPGAPASAALTGPAVPSQLQGPLSRWVEVPGPALAGANRLTAVVPVGGSDVWAVGSQGVVGTDTERSLALHWDGRRWTTVPSPGQAGLLGADGTGPDDLWAVGGTPDGGRSVIQHWDGRRWTEVDHEAASPGKPLRLGSVAALGPADVWAVGYRGALEEGQPHAQHWDGTAWREVDLPQPAGMVLTVLSAVTGSASNDVWAIGFSFDPAAGFVPYLVHWDGTQWSLVDVPPHITGGYTDLQLIRRGQLVAVGSTATPDSAAPVPVIASLDADGVWRQQPVPVGGAELNGVTVDATGTVWVVGDQVGDDHDDRQPLILHRRPGAGWAVAPSPVTEAGGLGDVQVVPGTTAAWAVGATGVTDDSVRHIILRTVPGS
jgi:hypothetical protein